MAKIYNPPLMQNVGPPHDPKVVRGIREALGLVHDELIISGDYEELEQRLLKQMDEFFGPEGQK